jgi:hypothetical protein
MADFDRNKDAQSGSPPGSAAMAAVLREAEGWASAQCEFLSGVGEIWANWMQRQREAINASTQSFTQLCESRDLADMAQIRQKWLADSVNRTVTDLSTFANDAVTLTWKITRAERVGDRTSNSEPPMSRRGEEHAPLHREAAE